MELAVDRELWGERVGEKRKEREIYYELEMPPKSEIEF